MHLVLIKWTVSNCNIYEFHVLEVPIPSELLFMCAYRGSNKNMTSICTFNLTPSVLQTT